jgi:uncharacterized glyoxalase superfamily protein PhnB/predicted kinase
MTNPPLVPLLVVRGAARAIDFYVQAFGARVLARYEHGPERRLSHADLAFGAVTLSLTEEARAWHSDAPESLGGSPVALQLDVGDAEATLAALQCAGASVLQPLQEWLGERMARIRDPFGHIWLLRQRIEELTVDEIQRRRDELFERARPPSSSEAAAPEAVASKAHTRAETLPASGGPLENNARLRHQASALQEPNARHQMCSMRQGQIHLVLGPVGAGKSTFALELAREQGALRFTLDEWMAVLFRPDRPETGIVSWYVERAERCVEQIWALASSLCHSGRSAVLEVGLLERAARERFYARVDGAGLGLALYVLDAPRELRRLRVAERNRSGGPTFSALVPPEIFELASDLWEPLAESECAGREVRFIDTGRATKTSR